MKRIEDILTRYGLTWDIWNKSQFYEDFKSRSSRTTDFLAFGKVTEVELIGMSYTALVELFSSRDAVLRIYDINKFRNKNGKTSMLTEAPEELIHKMRFGYEGTFGEMHVNTRFSKMDAGIIAQSRTAGYNELFFEKLKAERTDEDRLKIAFDSEQEEKVLTKEIKGYADSVFQEIIDGPAMKHLKYELKDTLRIFLKKEMAEYRKKIKNKE